MGHVTVAAVCAILMISGLLLPWSPDNGIQGKGISTIIAAENPTFNISVVLGWNLISLPLVPSNTALPNALLDLGNDTAWDWVKWYDASDTANHWKEYNTMWNGSLNDLTDTNLTMGLLINVTSAGDGLIRVNGSLPDTTPIPLLTTWNMVGYPRNDDSSYTVGQLKTEANIISVEKDMDDGTQNTTMLTDTYILKRGEGYWAYIPTDTIWTVDW